MSSGDPVILCWTGGWDSTFRLLQLLSDTNAQIQPLYLVDEQRESTPKEIEVMRDIRDDLEDRFPEASSRLLPTDYGSYRATQMEPHYKKNWEALKERGRVGLQYPILASYAEQEGIGQMEIGVLGSEFLGILLKSHAAREETPAGDIPVVSDDVEGEVNLFHSFAFPLLGKTKSGMEKKARERGWLSIMNKTWFCFNPICGFPCGRCRPCELAQEGGMGHRVGWVGPALAPIARGSIGRLLDHMGIMAGVRKLNGG